MQRVANSYLSLWIKLKLNPYCWVELTITTRVFYLHVCWHFQDFFSWSASQVWPKLLRGLCSSCLDSPCEPFAAWSTICNAGALFSFCRTSSKAWFDKFSLGRSHTTKCLFSMGIAYTVSIPTYHRSSHACILLAISYRFFNAAGRICLDLTWPDAEYIWSASSQTSRCAC